VVKRYQQLSSKYLYSNIEKTPVEIFIFPVFNLISEVMYNGPDKLGLTFVGATTSISQTAKLTPSSLKLILSNAMPGTGQIENQL
jgi:hypothetical protein